MKNGIILFILFSSITVSIAQTQPDSVNTIIGESDNITFFTGPFLRNKWFNNSKIVNAFGGGAGFYFHHRYYVYLQTTSFLVELSSGNNDKYIMNALGLSIGYCFNPYSAIHFVTGLEIYNAVVTNNKDVNPNNIKLNYLLLAPEFYVEVNLLSYVRLYVGPSYYVSIGNDSYEWINHKFINGFSFNFGLLVGKF